MSGKSSLKKPGAPKALSPLPLLFRLMFSTLAAALALHFWRQGSR